MRKGALSPLGIFALIREVRRGSGDPRPIAVAGARELVPILAGELRAGGDPLAVAENRVEGAAALVWVGTPDEQVLRTASRAEIPIVAVSEEQSIPYVFASAIVHVPPGQGFPVDEIARALAHGLGESGTSLAARLPALRGAVCDDLIESFSKRNALISAAVFVPGVDLPILTLNEIRLVLRIGLAHGEPVDASRVPEMAGVIGAGLGFRAVARELLDLIPVAGWAVKGAVAYTGTRAIGEAAVRYFASRTEQ